MPFHTSDSFDAKDSQVNNVEGGFLQLFMDARARRDGPTSAESSDEAGREGRPDDGRRST